MNLLDRLLRLTARAYTALVLIALSTAMALGPSAAAQVSLYSVAGEGQGLGFAAVAWMGDLDGDGVDDFASLHPDDDGQGTDAGALVARSGVDGSELFLVQGGTGDRLGAAAAGLGDTNGDGVDDLAVGAPGTPGQGLAGYVSIRSGSDGSELLRIAGSEVDGRFGAAVAGLGDMDGDGRGDVLIGAPGENGGGSDRGKAYVASGDDGATIFSAAGTQDGDGFGFSVGGMLPDALQGDADPTPIIGCSTPPTAAAAAGSVQVRSRSDFSLVRVHIGAAPGLRLGATVAPAGDLDGDGTLDYAAATDPRLTTGQPSAPASVSAWSGADGSLLLSLTDGETGSGFGSVLLALGDVDLDGVHDLAVGAPGSDANGAGSGRLTIHSGLAGGQLHALVGAPGAGFGAGLAWLGDRDGDALPDFIATEQHALDDDGRLLALSLTPWTDVGNGVEGSEGIPRLEALGSMAPGTQVTLRLTDARPLAGVTLRIGLALAYDSSTGTFSPTPDIVATGLMTNLLGQLEHVFTWPANAPPGSAAYYQYWIQDGTAPGGHSRSNTLEGQSGG